MPKHRHRPLTVAEHHQLADRIVSLAQEIRSIGDILADRFPLRISRQWEQATNPLLDLRNALEDDLIAAQIREGVDDGRSPKRYVGRTWTQE